MVEETDVEVFIEGREIRPKQGVYVEVDNVRELVVEYFGEGEELETEEGIVWFVPDSNPVAESVQIGVRTEGSKKNTLAFFVRERPLEELVEELGDEFEEYTQDIMDAKNDFLFEITGLTAKDRRDRLKKKKKKKNN